MKRFTLPDFFNFFISRHLVLESSGESSFKQDFSKVDLKGNVDSNQSSSRGISSLILLFLLFLFSNFLFAQTIVIDGHANEWSGNTNVIHFQDAFGNGQIDNQFTEGSKDFFFADDLRWSISQTKAKNDIANGAAGLVSQVQYHDNLTGQMVTMPVGNYLVFAGDRTSNNGDAQIGFWFYLNGTGPVTENGVRKFAPEHTRGDILVLADFTGGGANATVMVYRWIGGEPVTPGSTVVPNTNGNLETTNIASIVAENNLDGEPIPVGWGFLPRVPREYEQNEFYEGFVNLSALGTAVSKCYSTVLLETRSSQSITASLDDYIGGALGGVPTVIVNSASRCVDGPAVTLTATPTPAGTYTYLWSPGGQTTQSISVTDAGTYSVVATNADGCSTTPASGTVTLKPNPTCDIVGSSSVCPNSTSNNYSGPSGVGLTYSWSITGNGTIVGSGQNISVNAGNSCGVDYILTLIVTNGEGCSSTCTKTVSVQDTENPVIVDKPDVVLEGCNPAWLTVVTTTYSDNCDAGGSINGVAGEVQSSEDGCTQYIDYTFNFTDSCSNPAAPQTTRVSRHYDMTAPVFAPAPIAAAYQCRDDVPAPGNLGYTDNCDYAGEVMGVDVSDGLTCPETITRTWSFTDNCGNPASVSQIITVDDTEEPVIDANDYAICEGTLPETLTVKWTDNCSAGGELTAIGVPGVSTSCTTSNTYTFEVMDDCGNIGTKTITVTRETDTYANCETAFGKLESGSLCFLDDSKIKNNRWGWTNNIAVEGIYNMPLYAGASGCDITNRVPVGNAQVNYLAGKVTVVYSINPGYVMNEAHVYVGCEKYPMKNNKPTVAPGQYTFTASNLDKATGLTVNFTESISGPIWVIVHAVICEETCHCSQLTHESPVFDNVPLNLDCQGLEPVTAVAPSLIESAKAGFTAYPVPFKNVLTIRYDFDYTSDVKIEVFNSQGLLMLSKVDSNGYLNKEITLHLNSNKGQEQVYVVKVTTNRGSSIKKVMSSK